MTRGAKFFLLGSCLAAAGCTAATQNVKVRPLADGAAKFRYSGSLIAQGRAQLALGNVGLALETFRKAQREQPPGADTFAGIAACYGAMGRYDLARANYEYALAYAPNDASLLTALASSLDRLGESEQAGKARAEAIRLAAAPAQADVATATSDRASGTLTLMLPPPTRIAAASVQPAARSIRKAVAVAEQRPTPAIAVSRPTPPAIKMPSVSSQPPKIQLAANAGIAIAAPTGALDETTPDIAPPQSTPASVKLSSVSVPAKSVSAPNVEIEYPIRTQAAETVPSQQMTAAARPASVAPARAPSPAPAESLLRVSMEKSRTPVQSTHVVQAAPPVVRVHEPLIAQADPQAESGPRLQRLSPGVVSLVTSIAPVRPHVPQTPSPTRTDVAMIQPAQRFASADAVRWLPLKYGPPQAPIRLLNAARTQSLAARTRVALLDRGWSKIRIGNARKIRQHSLVLYASARWAVARRLAAHLGCKAVRNDKVQNVVVLLGRDAALLRRGSARA